MQKTRNAPEGWQRIQSKQDYRSFLAADLVAHGLARWHFYLAPKHPELNYQRLLRRVEYLQSRSTLVGKVWYAFERIRLARKSVITGISIPPGVFGPGLSIAHVGSIVVNDRARVGAWCRIHSGTNLGVYQGGAPYLGSHVYIAPGAVLYGSISVGSNVAIGANSVVNSDLPSGVVAVGSPGRVVSTDGSGRSLPDWFPAYAGESNV
ncbi:serine O-acetyltransferase [Kocuria flava]|uniref:serine O-acetyltransferase n=1 Tax=Kocuria flava TaxID=446860 RepID=UPI003557984E